MADILTHALLGAACAPDHPIIGAAFGVAPDVAQIPMNIYSFVKYRRLATGSDWDLAPRNLRDLYDIMHGVFMPAIVLFMAWFFAPFFVPFIMAYMSHILIDAPLHESTAFLFPLSNRNVSIGKNWWEDWRIPVVTISISALIVAVQRGLI